MFNRAPRELHHGQNETFLAYGNSYRIDYIYTVSLKWIPKNRPWCMGCNNNLYVHNMTITAVKVTSDGFVGEIYGVVLLLFLLFSVHLK